MLVSKSFVVIGTTSVRDGKYIKNIAERVDQVVNDFLSTLDGTYVDMKPNVQVHPGIGEDHAFITVIVDVVKPVQKEDEPVSRKKK